MRLFLCGDVMAGRGIDQILPHPGDPTLHEAYMKNALGYVEMAKEASGPINRPVDFSYIWGDALNELNRMAPDIRIINLETAVTKSGDYLDGKEVLYRMDPKNIPCIQAAKIDFCSLANNHVLDWGEKGLLETLETLKKAGLLYAGAGRDIAEAEAPAVIETKKGRVVVLSFGSTTSGIPPDWAAGKDKPGVNLISDFSENTGRRIRDKITSVKAKGDIVVFSIHWGGNWGYHIAKEHRQFAHRLIDDAGVDIIHGHSSHHVKGIEVYNGKLILYGAGDFINDYEGISGYEEFRGGLSLMYFADVEPKTGKLTALHMAPMRMRRFRVNRASKEDTAWLFDVISREGAKLGTSTRLNEDGAISLTWD